MYKFKCKYEKQNVVLLLSIGQNQIFICLQELFSDICFQQVRMRLSNEWQFPALQTLLAFHCYLVCQEIDWEWNSVTLQMNLLSLGRDV